MSHTDFWTNPHLDIKYELATKDGHEITCWIPVVSSEPSNVKTRKGLWHFPSEGKDGYFQTNKSYRHHITNLAKYKGSHFETQYSHLCHHWWCCNPDHIAVEPQWVNMMRLDCTFMEDVTIIVTEEKERIKRRSEVSRIICECGSVTHNLFEKYTIYPCLWPNFKFFKNNSRKRNELVTTEIIKDDLSAQLKNHLYLKEFKPNPISKIQDKIWEEWFDRFL